MFVMVIYACLTIGCQQPERADVGIEEWQSVFSCAAAMPIAVASWSGLNPGWKVMRAVCVPRDRVGAHIDATLGQGV